MLKGGLKIAQIVQKTNKKSLTQVVACKFGNNDLRNMATQTFDELSNNNWHYNQHDAKKSEWTHKSDAEQYIQKVPIIYTEQTLVRCMGGTEINAGHPQVYIKLDTRTPHQVQTCKYCGLRFALKEGAHHH
ncbi:hypothetical protein PPERSA_09452 [Pseudocohnilembus persalinus]|uniref:Zinc finger CHCC-type domain-containing protein n=1 Tax=Pseudocohnilembus persalinus TaxID=266149 RepID=A0A0V0Q9W0_PSEPJ|nr:hypothetical protein PPERSA_09452 [Pseudocohnilembus persalinus]|eukprot:KRW98927.1 hypothetical protein PPERSA_09452 [Pseudocohnilembus persalinus]